MRLVAFTDTHLGRLVVDSSRHNGELLGDLVGGIAVRVMLKVQHRDVHFHRYPVSHITQHRHVCDALAVLLVALWW